MSKTGTVKSWSGKFGFAETDNNEVVYIHSKEIDGGRLRVGRTVKFDTEAVEGHEGRVKGVNVSGEAVLPKGQKLSEEDHEADKKLREDIRTAFREENNKEYEPVKNQVDEMKRTNKVKLVHDLIKELKLGQLSDAKTEERRRDPTAPHTGAYTKREFIGFYGKVQGLRLWNLAASKGKKGGKRFSKKN